MLHRPFVMDTFNFEKLPIEEISSSSSSSDDDMIAATGAYLHYQQQL